MTDQTRSRLKLTTALAVAIALIAIVLFVLHSMQSAVEITAATASYQDIVQSAVTIGKVESVPGTEFQAHAGAPGIIEKILVKVGDVVKPGQLLIQMDDSDAVARLATADANLKTQQALQHDMQQGGTLDERNSFVTNLSSAELRYQDATRRLSSVQELQQKGAASAGEVVTAQNQVIATKNAVDAVQKQMGNRYSPTDVSRMQAQVKDAEAAVNAATGGVSGVSIRAPLAGTVYAIDHAQYDFVPEGDEILKVADLTKMQVRGFFDEPDIGKLAAGQPVTITWDAKSGMTWHGHVTLAPTAVVAYGTRNVGVAIIAVDDAHGDLEPNANVTLSVTTQRRPHVLSVPREALRTQGGAHSFVFVIQDGHLVKTPVEVGVATNNWAEILSGLSEGQKIALATTNSLDLADQMNVKITQ